MKTLITWLLSITPSLVARVLASLGIGLGTITGLSAIWSTIRGNIYSSFNGASGELLGFVGLSGIGEAMGILIGGVTARVAFIALTKSLAVIAKP